MTFKNRFIVLITSLCFVFGGLALTDVVIADAGATSHAGCASGLAPGYGESCSFYGWFRYYQLWGTGSFRISGPNGGTAYSAYHGYQNWEAYMDMGAYYYGHPGVTNTGCCSEDYWSGYVW